VFNQTRIGTWRRDFVYLIRPIWDTPPKPFHVIPHYAPPLSRSGAEDIDAWCGLHNFTSRGGAKPTIVDAVLLSSEVDMLEIRIREYKGIVNTFVVVESDRTFAGTEKRLYFEESRRKLEALLVGSGSRIVYHKVEGLLPGRTKGSFENEYAMRTAVSSTLTSLRLSPGSLILNSDVDEIISRDTLQLLASCNVPNNLHLNVKNYRYSWAWPILDAGYWRPHVSISDGGAVGYSHGRVGDVMLEGAGWHCTFCFATIAEMRDKMLGYSHNDRVRDQRIARLDRIRSKVCRGEEAFEMYPVSRYVRRSPVDTGTIYCWRQV
jgi:beta-1,4-mannosyl-glycoprotein beta-1,4-N-acetylglucosaminyltransferase